MSPCRSRWSGALALALLVFAGGCDGCESGQPLGQECARGTCAAGAVCFLDLGAKICVTKEDADNRCGKSKDCGLWGKCAYKAGVGRCMPTVKAHCEKSDVCKEKGRCTMYPQGCSVGGDDDCAVSDACKKHNKCKRVGTKFNGRCVDPAASPKPQGSASATPAPTGAPSATGG